MDTKTGVQAESGGWGGCWDGPREYMYCCVWSWKEDMLGWAVTTIVIVIQLAHFTFSGTKLVNVCAVTLSHLAISFQPHADYFPNRLVQTLEDFHIIMIQDSGKGRELDELKKREMVRDGANPLAPSPSSLPTSNFVCLCVWYMCIKMCTSRTEREIMK